MKAKIISIFSLLICVILFSSCEKERTELTIRYEITTSAPIATSHSDLGNLKSFATYAIDDRGTEETASDLSGTTWVKEIVIPKPTKNTGLGLGGGFYLSSPSGTVTAKIFIDGKLEVEHQENATALKVSNLSLVSIGTYYQFVYN